MKKMRILLVAAGLLAASTIAHAGGWTWVYCKYHKDYHLTYIADPTPVQPTGSGKTERM